MARKKRFVVEGTSGSPQPGRRNTSWAVKDTLTGSFIIYDNPSGDVYLRPVSGVSSWWIFHRAAVAVCAVLNAKNPPAPAAPEERD